MTNFIGWTVDERERYAYITGSPVASLLAAMTDQEWFHNDEQRHEIDMLKQDIGGLREKNESLVDLLEVATADLALVEKHADKDPLKEVKALCAVTL